MATVAMKKVLKLVGILLLRAPILRMSCSPDMAWITAAGTQEEGSLEESVGHQMKDSGGKSARKTEAQEHVTQLADRRIRQHTLDVVLHEAHGRQQRSQ